jgi:hypothetical protein
MVDVVKSRHPKLNATVQKNHYKKNHYNIEVEISWLPLSR